MMMNEDPLVAQVGFYRGGPCMDQYHIIQIPTGPAVAYIFKNIASLSDLAHIPLTNHLRQ